ncbi:hypothetical protein [Halovivax gelatinilyticus]|nr:hypothetical protein [Halovivax gelatinilyticus]
MPTGAVALVVVIGLANLVGLYVDLVDGPTASQIPDSADDVGTDGR